MSKRYTAGWITVPGKGRRWRTTQGEYLMQRPAGDVLASAWTAADRALGGWLPGGGVASPATRAVFPPQPYPGRSKELERLTGVRARIIDPQETPTLARRFTPFINPKWGYNDYANPLLNEIGISGYKGGARGPHERAIEFHELGHIHPEGRGVSGRLGVLGRYIEGISNATGNLPPVDLAAGMAMQAFDAKEEDRAERFAKKYESIGGYRGPDIAPDGTSAYGNRLRREGNQLVHRSLQRMTDPFGIVSGTAKAVNQVRAKPIIAEINQLEGQLRQAFQESEFDLTPGMIEASKRHSALEERLRVLGIDRRTWSPAP